MPKSPLESFFYKVFAAAEEAAENLIQDAGKQARENMRRMSRQLDRASSGNQAEPLPTGRKRAQKPSKQAPRPVRPPLPKTTLYDVLEISTKASPETISAAFRSLSTRFHPDTGKVKNDTRYKEITAAWTVLKDPEKRKRYDRGVGLI